MKKLTLQDFNTEIAEYKGLVVIDLYADWCAPCRMLAPILSELEEKYADVKFMKINVDEEPQLAEQFKVTSIPMVAFVKDDTFLDFTVGLVPGSEIEKLIDEYK